MATSPVTPKVSPQQLNAMQRAAVLAQSVEMTQQIFSQTLGAPIPSGTFQIYPRNVGLIKKFIVEISGVIQNTSAANAATITDTGLANVLQSIQFTDLNNNQRINTSGWHLAYLTSVKMKRPYGCGFALSSSSSDKQTMFGGGNVFPIIQSPITIAISSSVNVRAQFEVPLAYSDEDLRGAVFANVVNATMQMQLNVNINNLAAAYGADYTLTPYMFMTSGATNTLQWTSLIVNVYQVYLDQLPVGNQGVVLPILDLSTIYELKNTSFQAISTGQDFPIPYANFRDFLSTFLIYNNGTITSPYSGREPGSDLNYLALQSANFTNIFKIDPLLAAFRARNILETDIASGVYYFSYRRKPVSTLQYGNMELIINANAASPSAYALIGWEDFALVNTLTTAGSLAG